MKIVLVTGGRAYLNRPRVVNELDLENPDLVIHGDARGADAHAAYWVRANNRAELRMPAQWEKFGGSAGPRRNDDMTRMAGQLSGAGHDVIVLAFPGGKGTADCVQRARFHGLMVREIAE